MKEETVPGLVTVMGTVQVLELVVSLEVKRVELPQITSHLSKEVAVVLAVVLVATAQLHHLVQVCLEKEMSLGDSKTMEEFSALNFAFVIQIPESFIISI
jgi:hypothetical protein